MRKVLIYKLAVIYLLTLVFADGIWEISRKHSLLLGMSPINCLLPVHHEMWVASERNVHVISVTNKVRQQTSFMEVKQVCEMQYFGLILDQCWLAAWSSSIVFTG